MYNFVLPITMAYYRVLPSFPFFFPRHFFVSTIQRFSVTRTEMRVVLRRKSGVALTGGAYWLSAPCGALERTGGAGQGHQSRDLCWFPINSQQPVCVIWYFMSIHKNTKLYNLLWLFKEKKNMIRSRIYTCTVDMCRYVTASFTYMVNFMV